MKMEVMRLKIFLGGYPLWENCNNEFHDDDIEITKDFSLSISILIKIPLGTEVPSSTSAFMLCLFICGCLRAQGVKTIIINS
jgi:hypothetical protein